MTKLLSKIEPTDVIALVLLVGAFVLISRGLNGIVDTIILTIIGAYFGKKLVVDKIKKVTAKITLRELAEAMARFEGFYRTDYNTLAQKNNNPLNLRPTSYYIKKGWVDTKNNFIKFPTVEDGWEGVLWDLKFKLTKSATLGPEASLKDLIYTWSADNQGTYLQYVCTQLGIFEDYKLKNFVI